MAKRTVILGLLGSRLDGATHDRRWDQWRPTVSLFQHDELEPARLVLLSQTQEGRLAELVAADVRSVSPNTAVEHVSVRFDDPWDFAEVFRVLDDVARAYRFDRENEDYLVHITTGTHVAQICLFLLVETRRIPARLVQSSPRSTRGSKGNYSIIDLDLSRYDALAARFADEHREGVDFLKAGIATRNAGFNRLMERIEHVAGRSSDPILLAGPTGVGKTQLARRIYELKRRLHAVDGDFVEVNCATLRGDHAMATLFGHERGAFTGATARREGLLRAADGGLLFLDEIGELGLDEQAMLLRAIEEGVFLPLGADKPAKSRFQLIAGTNRDLSADVRAGRFREDLLARIDLWSFGLPPLTERREDIEPNVEHELARHFARTGRRVTFAAEARTRFLTFATSPAAAWRANFRDLGAALARLATLAPGGRITAPLVEEEIERLRAGWARLEHPSAGLPPEATDAQGQPLDRFDAVQLADVLRVCRESRSLSEAGRALFAVSRTKKASSNDADRLRKYLARFGLDYESARAARS